MWTPQFKERIQTVVGKCVLCRMSREIKRSYKEESLSRPGLNDMISLDTVGPVTRLTETFYVLVIIDHATKFAYFSSMIDRRGESVVKGLLHWIQMMCCPRSILTDNGSEFINYAVEQVLARFNIHRWRTSPYHPEGNGINEASHQMLRHAIRTAQEDVGNHMVILLANLAHNNSVHAGQCDTPAHQVFGKDMYDYLTFLPVRSTTELTRCLERDRGFYLWLLAHRPYAPGKAAKSLKVNDIVIIPQTDRDA